MNFYKEQDSTPKNITNCREFIDYNSTNSLVPNSFQTANKRIVKINANPTMPNTKTMQVLKPTNKKDNVSIIAYCQPAKQIKHNLPIAIQPDRKGMSQANEPNLLKNTSSSNNQEIGPNTSSDSLFKIPEIPPDRTTTNSRNPVSNERPRQETLKDPEVLNIEPSEILTKINKNQMDKLIDMSNSKFNQLHQQIVDSYKKNVENIKIDEETLKIILKISKENKNLVIEAFMTIINEFFHQARENSNKNKCSILKLAKIIAEIFQSVADTVTQELKKMYSDKSTQTDVQSDTQNLNEIDNNTKKQQANDIVSTGSDQDLNNSHQHRTQIYQLYQRQRLGYENNLASDKANNHSSSDGQTPKDIPVQNLISNTYEAQSVQNQSSPHILHAMLQHGNNERSPSQQNYNRTEISRMEHGQQSQFQNAQVTEQQSNENQTTKEFNKTNTILHSQNGKRFVDETHYKSNNLPLQMTNDTEYQKRKRCNTRDDITIHVLSSKTIDYNSMSLVDPHKRIKMNQNVSNNFTGMNETLENDTDVIFVENIPNVLETNEISKKNMTRDDITVAPETSNNKNNNSKLSEESFKTLLSLSQKNKNLLMKKYMSHVSEIWKLTQKFRALDEHCLANETNILGHVFQSIMDKLGKSYEGSKPRSQLRVMNVYTQTVLQTIVENVTDKVTPPVSEPNTLPNPVNNENSGESSLPNISRPPQFRDMYDYQSYYEGIQQNRYRPNQNQLNANQAQMRQSNTTSTVSNANYYNQIDPRYYRQQVTQPNHQPRPYVIPTAETTQSFPIPEQAQLNQYVCEGWHRDPHNCRHSNHNPMLSELQHQYNNAERSRYMPMDWQWKPWAAQSWNYPRNDWN